MKTAGGGSAIATTDAGIQAALVFAAAVVVVVFTAYRFVVGPCWKRERVCNLENIVTSRHAEKRTSHHMGQRFMAVLNYF